MAILSYFMIKRSINVTLPSLQLQEPQLLEQLSLSGFYELKIF